MLLICAASNQTNLRLAETIAAAAAQLSIDHHLVDLVAAELPLYSRLTEAQGNPTQLADLEQLFQQATGFVFCAPEYNGSIPPVLSNAIAWLSVMSTDFRQIFNRKPAIIASHSGGGGQKVLIAMRLQLSHLGCNVLGREIMLNKNKPLSEAAVVDLLQQMKIMLAT